MLFRKALWSVPVTIRCRLTRPGPRQAARFSVSAFRGLASVDESFDPNSMERTEDEVDLCIVGGGPAGLCAAIRRFKQLADKAGKDYRVMVLEKAPDLGAHILSGAVIETRALDELLPGWLTSDDKPANMTPVEKDKMRFLTADMSIPLPAPPQMHNAGNIIVEMSSVVRWLAEKAEALGIELYPGFGGAEVLYHSDGSVKGVATSDLGVGRDDKPTAEFERGMAFHARTTLFAEGAHGSLTKKLVKQFDLRKDAQPQTYGLGLKEVWEVKDENFRKGEVSHSLGFPLKNDTYGGGWMYHYGDNLVSVGLVVGLDYPNPWLNPYMEFQRMKHHPHYASVLKGGKCLSYGARALNEGGLQSIPKLTFPGGALIGCSAGLLNVPKIKGTHNAMKSGMLAAEAAFEAFEQEQEGAIELTAYAENLKNSWVYEELHQVRNIRPSFHNPLGNFGGILYSGLDTILLRGQAPWTLKHPTTDAAATQSADSCEKIEYPKPDGELSFDLLTNLARTGTYHEENIPVHLRVKDWEKHTQEAYPRYQGIETRFCPAGVYEYNEDPKAPLGVKFNINSQNCIHCKTCDIKVPTQDIDWQIPSVSGGPKYAY
ncbi:electron transfer flavo protein-ubiquinone oxidoreductase-like protein [Protomyces lactucae-debilis]|uniref:Electron transfer flavoprotein-ubiquinone oxidoreductase n=1 Tax=Protomyces lactucae-debilis TaxID=2754530 RepID=A0A1Y2FVG2_PROLT|nr:electron transfer flavo protein-ubiquinone oxidoreductase-like protein [Protomyces lactucae-debilis]ORY87990.1 electron transfer flavo protein-ubiquinone oxidoreductase-like protein [Protomyces lactucae-debilis]